MRHFRIFLKPNNSPHPAHLMNVCGLLLFFAGCLGAAFAVSEHNIEALGIFVLLGLYGLVMWFART